MQRVWQTIQHFILSEEGPTAVEYAVMLAFIITVCVLAIQSLGQTTSQSYEEVVNRGGFT